MNLARRRASASSSERRDEGNGMITVDLSRWINDVDGRSVQQSSHHENA
jgi:hypothetical protein